MSVHTDCIWLWYFLFDYPSLQKHFFVIFTTCHSVAPLCFLLSCFYSCFLLVLPVASFLFFLSICPFLHSLFPLFCSYLFSSLPHPLPPYLPTVGKWRVVKVPAWTGTPLGAVALPGPNSLAPVVMWTSSRLVPRQQHLSRSPPSTSIRKMDKPPS